MGVGYGYLLAEFVQKLLLEDRRSEWDHLNELQDIHLDNERCFSETMMLPHQALRSLMYDV